MSKTDDIFVLVCDENSEELDSTCLILKKLGVTNILCANTGAEALDLVGQFPVALVVLDSTLADEDGFEIGVRIKSLNPDTILIYHAKCTAAGCRLSALASGASGYVQKYTVNTVRDLGNAIKEWLDIITKRTSAEEFFNYAGSESSA